jgi:hypothetical protein
MAGAAFSSTELRAENGSNVWVCIIGSSRRHGSFAAFKQSVRDTYLDVSGVGTLNDLACVVDVPTGVDRTVGGFRLDVQDDDDSARVDDAPLPVDELPLMANRYVSGAKPGRVECGENRYTIRHPQLDLWVDHDATSATRTASDPQPVFTAALPTAGRRASRSARFGLADPGGGLPVVDVGVARPERSRRFGLERATP